MPSLFHDQRSVRCSSRYAPPACTNDLRSLPIAGNDDVYVQRGAGSPIESSPETRRARTAASPTGAHAAAYGIAADALPTTGTRVYFSLHVEHRARSGCFDKGAFNDDVSGDCHQPANVDAWLTIPAGRSPAPDLFAGAAR